MKQMKLPSDAGPLAQQVYKRMIALGLGQKKLAENAGLNETYVRDILRGRSRNPKHDHLTKLAKALGCTVLELADPRGAESVHENENVAQTPEEIAWLRIWRRASDVGRDRLSEAVENLLLGDLLGRSKTKDI